MVFFLAGDVGAHFFDLRLANGKDAVAALPGKARGNRRFRFQPTGRSAFQFFDDPGDGFSAGKREEEMNVIGDAADDERLAIVLGENAAQVAMKLIPQGQIVEERLALLG